MHFQAYDKAERHFPRPAERTWPWFQQIWTLNAVPEPEDVAVRSPSFGLVSKPCLP